MSACQSCLCLEDRRQERAVMITCTNGLCEWGMEDGIGHGRTPTVNTSLLFSSLWQWEIRRSSLKAAVREVICVWVFNPVHQGMACYEAQHLGIDPNPEQELYPHLALGMK
ncbi:hypothetical protein SRHO_G00095000 [Serrasalmus rhombeus]